MNKSEFLNKFATIIVKTTTGTPLFPSVAIAQCILESGWGRYCMGAANNFFGIKAFPTWKGKVISTTTTEVLKSGTVRFKGTGKIYNTYNEAITDGAKKQTLFRCYSSFVESIQDHTDLIVKSPRYAAALIVKTPEAQITEIKKAGYATATNYVKTIMQIINDNSLTNYDK